MTIRVICDGDGCGVTIDCDAGGWFGVDYIGLPDDAEPDGSGIVRSEMVDADHEFDFHFHTPDCLVSWAFARSFTPQPEGTPHE